MRILFAPGAGAASTSEWMTTWAKRLGSLGEVTRFDYPYMREGRKRPDVHATLVRAHREALGSIPADQPIVLAGKSMGSRIGCHVTVETDASVSALVCFGYPLVGQNGKMRDDVLRKLRTPILFVQGTRDAMCPIDQLEIVRAQMSAPNELHIVTDGDHSLESRKRTIAALGLTRETLEVGMLEAVRSFVARYAA